MPNLARRFLVVAVSGAAITILLSGLPLRAQEPTAPKTEVKSKAKVVKRTFDPTRRAPRYFGDLGLTDSQRESIYAIQGKEMPKIEALEKQILELRGHMIQECEGVLTSPQKQMLDHRRAAAAETRLKKVTPAKPQG